MHRRRLILRRFGALTFGLGYFEGGEWVDHTALPDQGRDLLIGSGSGIDHGAIHALLTCCEREAEDAAARVEPFTIRPQTSPAIRVIHQTEPDVDTVARRSSAL